MMRNSAAVDPYPAVDAQAFRTAMGHFATGVTVVGALDEEGTAFGSTANAITSVSLAPPLLLVCMRRESVTLGVLRRTGSFSLNVLQAGQADVAGRFARSHTADAWDGVDHHRGSSNTPLLDAALARIELSIHAIADGGDHEIVIGRVLRVDHPRRDVAPLLFYRGNFASLGAPV